MISLTASSEGATLVAPVTAAPAVAPAWRGILLCLLLIIVASINGVAVQAQESPAEPAPATEESPVRITRPYAPSKPATQLPPRQVTVQEGRGELLQFIDSASRVSVSDPAIADAVVISPHEVVVNGKEPGDSTVMIWHGESVSRYEVTVQPDLNEIQQELRASFPNEEIAVSSTKDAILLTGVVTSVEVSKRAAEIASIHAKSVVNLLQAPPPDPRQVMLQVKFASIDRTKLSQFGFNLFSTNSTLTGNSSTQQFSQPQNGTLQLAPVPGGEPTLGSQTVNISNLLNLFVFRPNINLGATIAALQQQNVLEILAEPNLVTVSGHEASFLAGGEFPFPVLTATPATGIVAPIVTIQFREFGVRLNFTPTVDVNGTIHLKVRPEVSSLDYSNALQISGYLIPALSTRRAETEVDLKEGESFAIAGLLDQQVTQTLSKVPMLGDVPIIGQLFRSHSTNKTNTELLVVITPRFVRPFAPGEEVALPKFSTPLLKGTVPTQEPEAPQFVGPRGHESSGDAK